MWWRDCGRHSCGEFSCAAIQANTDMEDHIQIETSQNSIFAGVYDGHGPEAALYIKEHLFKHVIDLTEVAGTVSGNVLKEAIERTENGFLDYATNPFATPSLEIQITGSCCLIGIIWKGTLYIANVGDSSAVIGSVDNKSGTFIGEKVTIDHNVSREAVRDELQIKHSTDPNIVVRQNEAWRLKGIIKVSRSIGDIYLKKPGFTIDPSLPQRYHLAEPIKKAVLTAEPSLYTRDLRADDKFIIFASHGFWEHVSMDSAVEIVSKNPRAGIGRKLLKTVLKAVNEKNEIKFIKLQSYGKGSRRGFHDDMSVIVIYMEHQKLGITDTTIPVASYKSFVDSEFRRIRHLM